MLILAVTIETAKRYIYASDWRTITPDSAWSLPETRDFFKTNSFQRVDLTPAQFQTLIDNDLKHWTRLINAVGARVE